MSETDPIERFAVTAESESETKTRVKARDFEFIIDEPMKLGGTNDGPTPVEYLIGAWAGCLNVVTQTVSKERGISLDSTETEIEIEGDLDPRAFLSGVDDVRAGYQAIRVQITVNSDADEESLAALATEVEQRCPVGDNITNPTPTDVIIQAT